MAIGGIIIVAIMAVAAAAFLSMLIWLMRPEEKEPQEGGE